MNLLRVSLLLVLFMVALGAIVRFLGWGTELSEVLAKHEGALPCLASPEAVDFGSVVLPEKRRASFLIRNPTNDEHHITRVAPSCACQKVLISGIAVIPGPQREGQCVLRPNETTSIDIDVDLKPGPSYAVVRLETDCPVTQTLTLGVRWDGKMPLVIEPPEHNLGACRLGEVKSWESIIRTQDGSAVELTSDLAELTIVPNEARDTWVISGQTTIDKEGLFSSTYRARTNLVKAPTFQVKVFADVIPRMSVMPAAAVVVDGKTVNHQLPIKIVDPALRIESLEFEPPLSGLTTSVSDGVITIAGVSPGIARAKLLVHTNFPESDKTVSLFFLRKGGIR